MLSSRTISGKVVAITGAGHGIGAAIARQLAGSGARVVLGDLDAASVTQLAAELGPQAVGLALDVTDPASFGAFLEAGQQRFGPLDVLVNNAGVMWVGPFAEEPAEIARRQFEVNVLGVITGFKLAVPGMRQRRSGQVVTIASAASKLTPRGEAAYAATKHAVYGWCCAVAAELNRSGVAVSIVMPTVVDTELAAGTSSGLIRALTPEDIAAAVQRAILTRRREIYVPGSIGLLVRLLAVLPARPGAVLGRWVTPNQLTKADRSRRQAYERKL